MNTDRLGRPNPLVGRPLFYKYRIELSLSKDQHDDLGKMAKRKHLTRAELLRTYITWGLEIHKPEYK